MNDYIDITKRHEAWKQISSNAQTKVIKMIDPVQTDSGQWQDPWSPPKK